MSLSSYGDALPSAPAAFGRAAAELEADLAAVLVAPETRPELVWFWSALEATPPTPARFGGSPGRIGEGPAAKWLRDWIAPNAKSFQIYTWQPGQAAVAVVFCFAAGRPRHAQIPDALGAALELISLAAWSVRETARLKWELRLAIERLAGRKVVERAKGILQQQQGISEEQAYEYLRANSRRRRITIAALAAEVVKAQGRAGAVRLSAA